MTVVSEGAMNAEDAVAIDRAAEAIERLGAGLEKPDRGNGWRSMAIEAAIRQGPSFVILLLLLFGMWHFANYVMYEGVPAHLQQIQQGYEQIQKTHSQDIERIVGAFERERLLIRDTHSLLEEAIEEIKQRRLSPTR